MKKEIIICVIICLLSIMSGCLITYKIMTKENIKYDLNNDKKVNILDLIELRNYILENME